MAKNPRLFGPPPGVRAVAIVAAGARTERERGRVADAARKQHAAVGQLGAEWMSYGWMINN